MEHDLHSRAHIYRLGEFLYWKHGGAKMTAPWSEVYFVLIIFDIRKMWTPDVRYSHFVRKKSATNRICISDKALAFASRLSYYNNTFIVNTDGSIRYWNFPRETDWNGALNP